MKTDKTERIQWLDIVRTVAILLVILVHVVEKFYFYFDIEFMDRSTISQISGLFLFALGRLGVPLFLFLTGYLLLQRKYDSESCIQFWKKKLIPLLICAEIWIVFFYFFMLYINDGEFDFWSLLYQMLFLKASDINHAWYLPMIIGMYICIPLISAVLQKFQTKIIVVPLIITIVYFMLIQNINLILNAHEQTTLNSQLELYFTGGVYGIYLIMGYLFQRGVFNKIKKPCWLFIFVISVFLTVCFQMYINGLGKLYSVYYNFILLVPASLAICGLLKDIQVGKILSKITSRLARDSFGIYLIHKPIQSLMTKYEVFHSLSVSKQVIATFVVIFVASFVIVELIALIPGVRKVLFLIDDRPMKKGRE